nr:MFS transporter [Rhodococcus opacus]
MTTTAPSQAGWSELLGPRYRSTSAVLAGGVGLHAVNIFLTTSLLPTAIGELGHESLYAWSATVFMVASVISSMTVSRLLAHRGPLGPYLFALAPFFAGTMICAIGPSMVVLLVGRAVQGIGGGLLAGSSYAVLREALPERLWARALCRALSVCAAANPSPPRHLRCSRWRRSRSVWRASSETAPTC